jgi:mannose-6-phosphate isomerase
MSDKKTIFCDIDGTLVEHCGLPTDQSKAENYRLTKNAKEALDLWEKNGYNIILTTGRKESMRRKTELELEKAGIIYDQLIMGLGGGTRYLINDRKEKGKKNTAHAINLVRNKGFEYYDFEKEVGDNLEKKTEKPWGGEELLECNDKYVMKKLFMKKGECCSLQYHELKKETVYVLSGKMKLYLDDDHQILLPGDYLTINPYTKHRMEGIEDSYYLEASTNELWDVVRLEDKYNREMNPKDGKISQK